MALRSTGQSNRRSMEPISRSAAMVRPSPSKLAKTKATHNAGGNGSYIVYTQVKSEVEDYEDQQGEEAHTCPHLFAAQFVAHVLPEYGYHLFEKDHVTS